VSSRPQLPWSTGNIDPSAPVWRERAKSIEKIEQVTKRRRPKSCPALPTSKAHLEWLYEILETYVAQCTDALALYRALPSCERFHASMARQRIVSGGNQAGKSLCTAIEFARILRGKDPYHKRAPKGIRAMVVAYDEDHVADVIWQKLWWPGAFYIIIDRETGLWRSVRWAENDPSRLDPDDAKRRSEWYPSPPIIPASEVLSLYWVKKGRGVPDRVILNNESMATFHTSRGAPRQGVELDYAWFDEEIENRRWLPEISARLVKRDGLFVWSATPQHATHHLMELHAQFLAGEPNIEEFTLSTGDNPFLSEDGKTDLYRKLSALGDDELRVRWHGEYAAESRRIYPQFDPSIGQNGVTSFRIPDDWMRILAVDPGTAFAAALFLAVPPDGGELHAYDEVFLRNTTAAELASQVKLKHGSKLQFEVFIIDGKTAHQTPQGFGVRILDHYARAFEMVGLSSRRTGSSFLYGNPDPESRTIILRQMMQRYEDGSRRLKVHRENCQYLIRQIQSRYYSKANAEKRERADRPNTVLWRCDLVDCLEYGAAWVAEISGGVDEPFAWYKPASSRDPTNQVQLGDGAYPEFLRAYNRAKQHSRELHSHSFMAALKRIAW
jgi:hypothetical protein